MQRAGDARALERLGGGVFAAGRHQARHFGLGDGDFLAPERGEAEVGDGVIGGFAHDRAPLLAASPGCLGGLPSKSAAAVAIKI